MKDFCKTKKLWLQLHSSLFEENYLDDTDFALNFWDGRLYIDENLIRESFAGEHKIELPELDAMAYLGYIGNRKVINVEFDSGDYGWYLN